MALKKCKECGNEISTKAESCPQCGAVRNNKTGCLGYIGAAFLIFIILGVFGSFMNEGTDKKNSSRSSSSVTPKSKPQLEAKTYKEGETVSVGYMSYAVWRSWWSSHLSSNQFIDHPPNAMYLFVNLTVRNDDKKARTVPPFKLIDENGAEYDVSSRGWLVEGSIGLTETLNPSVNKQGSIVFDVPNDRDYRIKLSGGYWSAENAYVQINPK